MKVKTRPKVEPVLWDIYRDGVTQSLLTKFLTCPEKMRLATKEGLVPSRGGKTAALDFGTLIHEALDRIYYKTFNKGMCVVGMDVPRILGEIEERDREIIQEKINPADDAEQNLDMTYGLAEAILPSYFTYWHKDFMLFDWVSLEEVFSVPYESTLTGKTIQIRGKFDGIMRFNKRLWLFETKTKSRIEEDSIVDSIGYNLQVCMYLRAMKKIYGEEPAGVVYNIIRRPGLRFGAKETLPEFLGRCTADIKGRPDFYFMRYDCAVMPNDLNLWNVEFDAMMTQLERWHQGEFNYRNSASCRSVYGACEFLPVCGRNDRSDYIKVADVFPELKPHSDF